LTWGVGLSEWLQFKLVVFKAEQCVNILGTGRSANSLV
jgi:hypothetical protein